MKFGVLGATGPSGLLVVSQSLARGHNVLALVRNPAKITQKHENLQVVKTNIFSTEELTEHFRGCDAIISCIGGKFTVSRVTLYSECIKAVKPAMNAAQVNRLVCLSSWHSKRTSQEPFFWWWGVRPIIGRMLDDLDRMETYLSEECSDIDYTVVRLPYLSMDEKQDKEILVEENICATNTQYKMGRANVASFVIEQCVEQELYKKKLVSIGFKN